MTYPSSEILNIRIRVRIHMKKVLEREKTINDALKILGISERTVCRYGFRFSRITKYQKFRIVTYDKSKDHQD